MTHRIREIVTGFMDIYSTGRCVAWNVQEHGRQHRFSAGGLTFYSPRNLDRQVRCLAYKMHYGHLHSRNIDKCSDLSRDGCKMNNDSPAKRSICPVFCAEVGQNYQGRRQIADQTSQKRRKHFPSGKKICAFFRNRVIAVESLFILYPSEVQTKVRTFG